MPVDLDREGNGVVKAGSVWNSLGGIPTGVSGGVGWVPNRSTRTVKGQELSGLSSRGLGMPQDGGMLGRRFLGTLMPHVGSVSWGGN